MCHNTVTFNFPISNIQSLLAKQLTKKKKKLLIQTTKAEASPAELN